MQLSACDLAKRNSLLARLPNNDLVLLTPHLEDIALNAGTILHEPGEPISNVYFPCDGIISLLSVMQEGDAVDTATVGREGAIGVASGFGLRRSYSRALVQVSGRAFRIPATQFRRAAELSQAIRDLIMHYSEMLTIQMQQAGACNALHGVEERLSRWLLQAHDRIDAHIVRLTHDILSQTLGVRRPTVTVVAQKLQDAGFIRYHRGNTEILDRPGLEARACECYRSSVLRMEGDTGRNGDRAQQIMN
jgi:CRP-like cAMP-binding protein